MTPTRLLLLALMTLFVVLIAAFIWVLKERDNDKWWGWWLGMVLAWGALGSVVVAILWWLFWAFSSIAM